MFSNNIIPSQKDVTKGKDLYVPGDMDTSTLPDQPDITETSSPRDKPWSKIAYSGNKPFTGPKGVPAFTTPTFTPFRPQNSLRRRAKQAVFNKLAIIPSGQNFMINPNPEASSPEYPFGFVDGVPNFSEVPFGSGNLKGSNNVVRGRWGQLNTALGRVYKGFGQAAGIQYGIAADASGNAWVVNSATGAQIAQIPGYTTANMSNLQVVGNSYVLDTTTSTYVFQIPGSPGATTGGVLGLSTSTLLLLLGGGALAYFLSKKKTKKN
jgi:hypothetical protein